MKVHPVIFWVSAVLVVLFVILGTSFNAQLKDACDFLQTNIVKHFGWFYIASVGFFLAFSIWIGFSRYGHIRLGADDESPKYNYLTWFSMLFSAGMGIGLLFFSVAEPLMHFAAPPRADAKTIAAAKQAMNITFFHWGLHAWGIYIVVGLSLAYAAYRKGMPLTIRATLHPLLGERIHGPIGYTVEIMAVFGTLFGLATSLGLGVKQINAGMAHLGFLEFGAGNQIGLIVVITLIATASVVSGLDVGIRRLSELNIGLGLVLLLFVFIAGPTVFLLNSFTQSIGTYISTLPTMTFRTDAFVGAFSPDGDKWMSSWTLFYWAWWIAWAPFVGMFVARISRGRTIREFVLGVMFVPTLLTFFWLVVFGNTAINMELDGAESGLPSLAKAAVDDTPVALFYMLERLPWSSITCVLATIVIATYFVTSSDSASMVIDILTTDGQLNPPVGTRIFWALTEGAVAAVLLYAGGGETGLQALQSAALTTALPFCAIMWFMCWALVKSLNAEVAKAATVHAHHLPRPQHKHEARDYTTAKAQSER